MPLSLYLTKTSKLAKILLGLIAVLILGACATTKKKSDQSGLAQFYHNQTARFNGYFNANELIEESIITLNSSYQDNYIDLLEVYKYRGAPNPEVVNESMDEAIKKVSVVGTLHENSVWIDDCYLLIGKAFYLKQDFESAQNALEFFMDEFEPDGSRSKNARAKKNAKKRKGKSKTQRQKSSRKRAKQLERERKKYNKQLKKKRKREEKERRKKSKRSGTEDEAPVSKRGEASKRDDNIVATKRAGETAKRDEKEEKDPAAKEQNPGGIKHKPCYQQAELWLARTYVDRELYPRAEYYLNSVQSNPYKQDDVIIDLPRAWAYYHIKRNNFEGAIPYLEEAIEVAKNRQDRARLTFILAQILEMNEKTSDEAYEMYQAVIDLKPNYEMEFNAKMSMARTAFFAGQSSVAESKVLLEKMLKDEKNFEYHDRIYYTYARLYMLLEDPNSAIIYLEEAVKVNSGNPTLSTEIHHLLATLYFERKAYVEAKTNYDAALTTMSEEDERYEETERLSKSLTEIAENLQTIALQDSLLKLSKMSEKELRDLAKQLRNQPAGGYASSNQGLAAGAPTGGTGKKGGRNNPLAASNIGGPPSARRVVAVNTGQSNFFAYDDKAKRRGEREFFRTWGGRQLTDNWRVSSKINTTGVVVDDIGPDDVVVDYVSEDEFDRIFADVPKTPEDVAAAEGAIQEAMVRLGYLYREKMEDPQLSIDMLKEMLRRFPESEQKLEAYYQLYLDYLMLNDSRNADIYARKIMDEFPGTKYALALSDPDYVEKQLSEERKVERHYEQVYAMVNDGQYSQAKTLIDQGRQEYGTGTPFDAKLAIMDAMCVGNMQGKDAYIEALKGVISGYPGTDEETKAKDMLLLLGEYKGTRLNLAKSETAGAGATPFKVQPNSTHYLLVMIENYEDINSKDAKVSISNYNRKYHQLDRLKISSLVFDPKTGKSVILVRSFKNAEEAMKYKQNAEKHPDEFMIKDAVYELYPVSQYNYREIIKERSIDSYRPFFEANYK